MNFTVDGETYGSRRRFVWRGLCEHGNSGDRCRIGDRYASSFHKRAPIHVDHDSLLAALLVHCGLPRATSAALMPSNASPYPTPSSMMRRSFWVSAMRVYLVVSGGSLASPSAISRARASSLSARRISLTAP